MGQKENYEIRERLGWTDGYRVWQNESLFNSILSTLRSKKKRRKRKEYKYKVLTILQIHYTIG